MLLCVALTVLNPLAIAASVMVSLDAAGLSSEMEAPDLFQLLTALPLAGFSVYAGLKLWQVRSGAVRTAMTYLIVGATYGVFMEVMWLAVVSDEVDALDPRLLAETSRGIVRAVLPAIVWGRYLQKSKRVKATYGLH